MSRIRTTLVFAAAAMMWFGTTSDQSADAQVSVQFGTSRYYGNQPVYRSYNYGSQYRYTQPSYRYSQLRNQTYSVAPQRYSSGYRGFPSAPVYGNSYQSFRPNYSSQPYYGQSYSNGYYGGYNNISPSQQRGAIIGGAIGNAVSGNRGGNLGAAIGAAVQSQ